MSPSTSSGVERQGDRCLEAGNVSADGHGCVSSSSVSSTQQVCLDLVVSHAVRVTILDTDRQNASPT